MTNSIFLKKSTIIKIITYFILFISIMPLIVISFYSRPCVDDFGYSDQIYRYINNENWSIVGLVKNAISVDIYYYNNWQGLYSSAFVLALQPAIWGTNYYFIGALALLILEYVCILYFVHTVCLMLEVKVDIYLVTLFIFVAFVQGLPSAVQGLYWYNGAWNYIPFFFMTLVNISLVLRYIFIKHTKKYIFFSMLMSIIISGGNHVTAFMNILLLLVMCIVAFIKHNRYPLFSLMSALIGFGLVMIAPGTAVRQNMLNKQGTLETIINGFSGTVERLTLWTNKKWFIYISIIVVMCVYLYKKNKIRADYFNVKVMPLLLMIVSGIIMCGMLCVPYKAMGGFGDDRLQNVIWMFFMMSSTICVAYLTMYLLINDIVMIFNKEHWNYKLIVLVLIIFSIYNRDNNGLRAYKELTNGVPQLYAEVFDSRIKLMTDTDDSDQILYSNALPYSEFLYFSDISDDISDWRNDLWEKYFGKKMVAVSTNWISKQEVDKYIDNFTGENKCVFVICPKEQDIQLVIKAEENEEVIDELGKDNNIYDTIVGKVSYFTDNNAYGLYYNDKELLTGNTQIRDLYDYIIVQMDREIEQIVKCDYIKIKDV